MYDTRIINKGDIMFKVLQLKIDIHANKITKKMYDKICKVIKSKGFQVVDGPYAPYVEDITEAYKSRSIFGI